MLLGKKIGNSKRENKLLLYVFVRIRVKTFIKGGTFLIFYSTHKRIRVKNYN